MPESNRPTLPPDLFSFFAEHIYTLSGMRFDESKSYFLAAKITLRLEALHLVDFEAYRTYLTGPHGAEENPFLLDKVTINETFFYRHEPQLRAFQTDILSPLLHTGKPLRIWSAASSSGDELYTLALMLQQLRPLPPIELIGTDISHDALAKARSATYRKYNIRNIPADQLQTYFTHHPTQPELWSLTDDIKQRCTFRHGNIMDSTHTQSLGKFDIIFCRNMLIYFDNASKRTATTNLANALTPGGLVLLGTSDDIYSQRTILKPHPQFSNALAYIQA